MAHKEAIPSGAEAHLTHFSEHKSQPPTKTVTGVGELEEDLPVSASISKLFQARASIFKIMQGDYFHVI